MNAIALPEANQAIQLADSAYDIALAIEIDSNEMFALAGDELRSIKSRSKKIEDLRLSLTRPLDDSKKRIMDMFRQPLARLEEAEALLKKGMMVFQQAEREKAERARKEAEAIARREREDFERRRKEAEAAEQKAREEAAAALREGNAEAASVANQAAADASIVAELALVEIELAEVKPIAMPAVVEPNAAGISARQTWKAEVTDLRALVVAAGKAAEAGDTTLLGYLQADTKALGQVAKALKQQARIPGVKIYAEEGLSVRRYA